MGGVESDKPQAPSPEPALTWRACVPLDPPSQNHLLCSHYMMRVRKVRKIQKAWFAFLYAGFARHTPKAERKRRMEVIRHHKNKRDEYDDGNLVGGFKPILDLLTRPLGPKHYGMGLLVDDSPDWLDAEYSQVPDVGRGKDNWTEVILIEPRDTHE